MRSSRSPANLSATALVSGCNGFMPVRRHFPQNKRSEEHTSELQSRSDLVCRLLLEKKKKPAAIQFLLNQNKLALQSRSDLLSPVENIAKPDINYHIIIVAERETECTCRLSGHTDY